MTACPNPFQKFLEWAGYRRPSSGTPSTLPTPVDPRLLDTFTEERLRSNERIWAGFREIELRILAAETLPSVIEVLARDLPIFFAGVDAASIAWLDPEYELSRLFTGKDGGRARTAFIALHQPLPNGMTLTAPYLGQIDVQTRELLFPNVQLPLQSTALVPLRLRGQWCGSLNQASTDPWHFNSGVATDLLEHLAAVTAICIDNTINRARLRRDGLTDPLTGVANRRFLDRRLMEEVSQWRRRGGNLSCLLVDLDHFKQINDRHGHQVGDQVLYRVARSLNLGLRNSDVLARYGGEEFILLLPQTDGRTATEIAERLRMAVAGLVWSRIPELRVTTSIGLATLSPERTKVEEESASWLLRQADQALYKAKANGRNAVAMADAGTIRSSE